MKNILWRHYTGCEEQDHEELLNQNLDKIFNFKNFIIISLYLTSVKIKIQL